MKVTLCSDTYEEIEIINVMMERDALELGITANT